MAPKKTTAKRSWAAPSNDPVATVSDTRQLAVKLTLPAYQPFRGVSLYQIRLPDARDRKTRDPYAHGPRLLLHHSHCLPIFHRRTMSLLAVHDDPRVERPVPSPAYKTSSHPHATYDPITGNDDGDDPEDDPVEDDNSGGKRLSSGLSLPEGYILFRCRYLRSEYSASVSTTPKSSARWSFGQWLVTPPPLCRRL